MWVADGSVVVVVAQPLMAPDRAVRLKVLDPAMHRLLRASHYLGHVAGGVALLQQTKHVLTRLLRKYDDAVGGSVAVVPGQLRRARLG